VRMRMSLLVLILGGLGVVRASAEVVNWTVDGQMRKALVFGPAPQQGKHPPLVLAFHGRGDNVDNFQGANLHLAWPDAVVVYFQGLQGPGGPSGWQVERGQDGDRDLKLVDVALASLRETYGIDDDRVYATGFSNGAMFTYLLWTERPTVFAAYAVVAGRLRASVRPLEPKPLLAVAGMRDLQVKFSDQRAAISTAVRVNGVSGQTVPCGWGCTVYGADTLAPVVAWVHKGAHEYPQGTSVRITSFFQEHARTH